MIQPERGLSLNMQMFLLGYAIIELPKEPQPAPLGTVIESSSCPIEVYAEDVPQAVLEQIGKKHS